MINFEEIKDEEIPHIHNVSELKQWLRPTYVIYNYMNSYEDYDEFMKEILIVVRGSFTIQKCREFPVKFKFYENDKKTHTLELRHFLINIILWYPIKELYDTNVLDESFIFDCYNNIPKVEDYINFRLIQTLREYNVKPKTINRNISNVLNNLRAISIDFSLIIGLNFSAKTFFDLYNENSEIRDIMEVTFSENLQPHEIEEQLSMLQNREIEIYKSIKDNPIGMILRTETGIKPKQFAEFTISEGLKPSLEGKTIPIPIENSTMLKGLDRPSYLFIDGTGARKSLVMNKKVINFRVTICSNVYEKSSLTAGNF